MPIPTTDTKDHLTLGVSAIMRFRFAYLRAIADAWSEPFNPISRKPNGPNFENLVWQATPEESKDYNKQKEWDVFTSNKVCDSLNRFRYKTPWNVIVNIVWRGEGPAYLETEGKYEWKHIYSDEILNDKFIINLPSAPKSKELWAEALSEYYKAFPTLFGIKEFGEVTEKDKNCTPEHRGTINGKRQRSDAEKKEDYNLLDQMGVSKLIAQLRTGNIGVSGHEPGDFIDFGGTVLAILAKTWENPKFPDPDTMLNGIRKHLFADFLNIWHFRIEFNTVPGCDFDGAKWNFLPKNVIQLNFPHKPEAVEIEPIALASYNNTGKEFPLTCF